ncbi:radical SAM protein, partial (plasmid) [Clostridium perfringens]
MLKKIRIKDELFAFDSETFDFFEVTEKDEITEKGESIGNDNEEEKKSDVFNDSGLNRLTLNMSNMCNLNCKYCYANGGNYNRPNKIMSRESFNNILNDLKNRNIKKIREVKFFGGEPTINNNLIVEALEILSKDYDVDKYMIVTNGTLLTKDFITECLKYNCYFAISLDGPEDINDFLRGKETFNTVINNLNSLFDDTFKKRVELLCTFTPYHLKNGYSKETLSNFFKELGFKYTITKVGSDKVDFKFIEQNSTVDVFNDIDKSLNCILKNTDDKNINSYVYEFMLAIAYGQKALKFCDELIEDFNLSYDYNGDPYICYRFWGK